MLDKVRNLNCVVCGKAGSDPHHIKTRGAGGGDLEENLVSLCRLHHSQIHLYGLSKMVSLHPNFEYFLKEKGWEVDQGRWTQYFS